jgi:hypothetical protein
MGTETSSTTTPLDFRSLRASRTLIADRMMKTLFEERDAQTLHVAIERLHVIADWR